MHSEPTRATLGAVLVVAALLATLASAYALPVGSTYGGRAAVDEPHYLLTAISLAEDADLDVSDELAAERWRDFHRAALPQQAEPTETGRAVSPHDPLLPLLVAVPYDIGGLDGARWAMAVMNGLLAAALVHLLVRRLSVPTGLAAVAAVVAGASVPLVVYGQQVYPEVPAALALTLGASAALGPSRWWRVAVVGLAVVALPWLSVKYVPTAATLAGLHLWRLRRDGPHRSIGWLLAGYAVAAATYAWGHLAWYGGLTVYAAGDFFQDNGGQLSVLGTRPNPAGRTPRLVGLLIDRHFGVASWQPAWLALPAAAAAALRHRGRDEMLLVLIVAVGWLNATYLAVTMHGWWFPGRQIVHVLPLAAALMAVWLARRGPVTRTVLAVAAGLGVWTALALIAAGRAGQLTFVVDFASLSHPWRTTWADLLPDHRAPTIGTWAVTVAWSGLLALSALAAWRAEARGGHGESGLGRGV